MQEVSQAYKQSMEQTAREGFYLDITMGVINQAAQGKAYVEPDICLDYANLKKPFQDYEVEYTYATMEEDFFRVDGRMLFLPEEGPYFNAGLISAGVLGEIKIHFADGPYDIKGLTIDFGDAYPVDFIIQSDKNKVTITENDTGHFVTEEIFNEATFITIIPLKMVRGNQRLRIEKMKMGIGVYFTNKEIKSATEKEYLSIISEELPTYDLSVSIKNKNRIWDVENRDSSINYLEIGQECRVRWGKLLPNGTVEYLDGATLHLDTWKADDETMSFTAKDVISDLSSIYYRGRKERTSLYDLAVDVLTDAGLDERMYELDTYLQEVHVSNPMPAVPHKEALQIIANASRCVIYQDRQGIIRIKAGFTTVISPERMEVCSDHGEDYSDLAGIVLPDAKYDYARMYQDYFKVDGGMYFLPESGNHLTTGFVSRQIADAHGRFASNPCLTVRLEAAFRFFGVDIEFAGNPPAQLIIHTYKDDILAESYPVTVTGTRVSVIHAFPEFDTMEFEVTRGYPHNAVIVNYIKFGDVTDYKFTYRNMTKTPMGEQVEKYKDIQVQMTRYSESTDYKQLYKDTVNTGGICTLYLTNAGYGYATNAGKIIYSSAYCIMVDLSGIGPAQTELIISGYEYIQAVSEHILVLNTTGGRKEWSNPLVSEPVHAAVLAEWIGNYLNNNVEYDISYRGDFRLDVGDITFLENKYIDKLQIAVCEHTLDFASGALKGTIKARRAQNGVDRA